MGAAAAAIVMRKERDVVEAYQRAGAIAPSSARSLDELGIDENMIVQRLRKRAVLRDSPTDPGRLYLDEASWRALNYVRRRIAIVMLVLVALAGFAIWLSNRGAQ
jgi:hypothetical protein